jgi:tRNA A37 N6-isopentenylltransferase MiaA
MGPHALFRFCCLEVARNYSTFIALKQSFLNISTIKIWGWIIIMEGGAILYIIGCLVAPLTSIFLMSPPFLIFTTKNISRHCQMSL